MNLNVGIYFEDENGNIVSKRAIGNKWYADLEKNSMKVYSSRFTEEFVSVLLENIKLNLTTKFIKEMMNDIKGKEID